ncbi:MAG: ABC transporter permease [Candidatus Kerfeldbacteria bacterium]|nr:ABC transporter permease [Candidatus Kerfeldbacteria bacterium]
MKISLAQKNLFHEPARLLISVSGVTFAVFLIMILLGLYRGWSETLSEYIHNVDAQVWVMQQGSIDMSHSISLLPNQTADQLKQIKGVEAVHYLIGNRIVITLHDDEVSTRVIGFDTTDQIGKPVSIVAGEAIPAEGEIVIDQLVHDNHDVNIGDTIDLNSTPFTVIGISAGGPLFQQSYIRIEDARALFHMEDVSNFFVVSIAEEQTTTTVMNRIEDTIPGVDAQTEAEFAENNEREIMDKFLPIILVLVCIGFIVGVVIISLTIYTATIEKIREYGVLKAIGAPNFYLYRVVLTQSSIAGGIGFILGTGLTYFGSDVIKKFEPLFVTLVKWQDVVVVAGMTLAMIILAAYIPLRRMIKIDPAIVFKA